MLNQIKRMPAWAKVVAIVTAVLVVAGGVGIGVGPRLGFGRAARSAARPAVTATPQPAAPTPSPNASLPPLASTLACRLPVSSGQPGSGGFVTFPQGTFAVDPGSALSGVRYGLSFDRAAAKWVPAPRSLVAPDGSRRKVLRSSHMGALPR